MADGGRGKQASLRSFVERLDDDFDADQCGYRQLAAITDEGTRAVACDEIGQSAF